ncbi:integral membrane protein with PIN domain [Leptospira ryugenii]|uniref:Integral membrane protein with PIN domain n=1 Tax=Leptospira ryugenii TaxID=1917863 RepID=A0A2P2E1W3_9LEPT|nr:PIN domain-containing protein [Leptospira ryugenii]GBF50786.1 integral membrane protein with PIN domain [Leptospira ryugenii]
MRKLLSAIGSIVVGLASYLFLYAESQNLILSLSLSGLVLIYTVVLAFGEKKLYPEVKADTLLLASLFGLLGLGLASYPASLLNDYGWKPASITLAFLLFVTGVKVGLSFAKKPGLAIFGGGGVGASSGTSFAIPGLEGSSSQPKEKILDTSVVIDGRILDIADTHFLDGPLILPNFVLREIQLISDSSDPIKRARGRRGLEMLNKLQRKGSIEVKITYTDYSDTREVDAKLVKLARDTGAAVVTNDFNLNKVAELQGVRVLNLNNLANALKPVVLPGEEFPISVIKEGKDENQGIGYLEDGTMVVIENGGHLVNKEVRVVVTSIIQTAAGKMIFTKVQNGNNNYNKS